MAMNSRIKSDMPSIKPINRRRPIGVCSIVYLLWSDSLPLYYKPKGDKYDRFFSD
jgi:hypothetical protein